MFDRYGQNFAQMSDKMGLIGQDGYIFIVCLSIFKKWMEQEYIVNLLFVYLYVFYNLLYKFSYKLLIHCLKSIDIYV